MSSVLELIEASVAIEDHVIVHDMSFELHEGDIGCLLGPSGCGKTTLLRGIAGLERTVSGEVRIRDEIVAGGRVHIPVEQRRVGMMFQDFALFPHLTVHDNIAFGLNRMPAHERHHRIHELAEMLEITGFLNYYPHQLSGGQQQRVALARAMAPRPRILLMDEPFASMDVELREQIAREVRTVLKEDGITAILVSHNQYEAFAMADVIGVMRDGRLLQWDTAFRLYHQPASAYVADFVGEGTFIPGEVIDETRVKTELGVISGKQAHGYTPGSAVSVLIRPDDILHEDSSDLSAVVLDKAFRGAEFLYTLALPSGAEVLSLVPSHHDHPLSHSIGIRLEIDHLVVFPDAGESQESAVSNTG